MAEPYDYTITVKRVEEDGEALFVASVKELPHVHGDGPTFTEAYEMAIEAIQALQQLAAELDKPFPLPATEPSDEWSGRFSLRLPKSLHRKAAQMADEEGVSLNQFLSSIIAEVVGTKSASIESNRHIELISRYITMTSTSIESSCLKEYSPVQRLWLSGLGEPNQVVMTTTREPVAYSREVGHG